MGLDLSITDCTYSDIYCVLSSGTLWCHLSTLKHWNSVNVLTIKDYHHIGMTLALTSRYKWSHKIKCFQKNSWLEIPGLCVNGTFSGSSRPLKQAVERTPAESLQVQSRQYLRKKKIFTFMTRYLSPDKYPRRYSSRHRNSPPPSAPASTTPPTLHSSSSPLSSSSKSSLSPQPSSETSSEKRLTAYSSKLEKHLAVGEDVEEKASTEEEIDLAELPYIPDPDYATPYIPGPATPSPDYERERKAVERKLWGNANRYLGKQASADPTRTLKEALKNRLTGPPKKQMLVKRRLISWLQPLGHQCLSSSERSLVRPKRTEKEGIQVYPSLSNTIQYYQILPNTIHGCET